MTGNELNDRQQQAFKRIELISLWEGRLNTSHLTQNLGVSRATASALINEYKKYCPKNLIYDQQAKAYQPTEQFSINYSSGLLDDYLSLGINNQHLYRLSSSHQQPNPAHVRPILYAILHKQRLDISYASLKNPDGEERIISPHTLINDGKRWHVGAWCGKNKAYRDFVLTRIRQVFGLEGIAEYGAEQDQDWNTNIAFSIEPDPRLDTAQQQLIALDYGMQINQSGKYQRHYKVPGPLVMYWCQYLRIDRYRETPEAQQIILSPECHQKIQNWLPK